jgi:RNA polymerase sigma factor (sigma-70 family)
MTAHALITENLQFARNVARQKYGKYPSVSYDEIESAAYMGLVEAAQKYDPELNDTFPGYAYPRIAGAIGDYVRELQWGTRANPVDREEINEEVVGKNNLADDGEFFDKLTFNLNKSSKTVMRSYYVENKKIREIAEEMGVHESRVSQVLSESRMKLKASWQDYESELWAEVA